MTQIIKSANQPFKNDDERIAFLESLKLRAAFHQSATASAVVPTLDKMIGNLRREDRDEVRKEWELKVQAARDGDVEAKAEVSRIRIVKTMNFLVAMSNWGIFFNSVTLEDNETPYWQNMSQQEVVCYGSGQDGRRSRAQVVKYMEQAQVFLSQIASDIVEYFLVDFNKGSIADETRALVDIARDLKIKVDQFLKPFALGMIQSAWTTTGKGSKASNVFQLHSVVNTNNIPAGNYIDASGGSATHFGKAAMDLIIQYCLSWADLFGEGLRPESILFPSIDTSGYLGDVTWTSQNNPVSAQLLSNGVVADYGGFKWNLVPDVTLDPTAKYCYVKLNRAIGEFYTKPSLAKSRDIITPESERNNKGQMFSSMVVGAVTPLPWSPFILRVKYKA